MDPINLDDEGSGPCDQGEFVDPTNYAECVPFKDPSLLEVLGGTINLGYWWLDFLKVDREGKPKITLARSSKLVLDAEVDEEAYRLFVKNNTTRGMLFSRGGGQGRITRAAWKKMFDNTDPLKNMIIKTLNREIRSGSVHFG